MTGSKSRVWAVLCLTLALFATGVVVSACVDRSSETNLKPYDGSWFKGRRD